MRLHPCLQSRSYGVGGSCVQHFARLLFLSAILFTTSAAVLAAAEPPIKIKPCCDEPPIKIVVLGDSLSAGYGLPAESAFPTKLAAALTAALTANSTKLTPAAVAPRGLAVTVINAGVSGDTASAGLERLDWSVPEGTDAVILELGANDALRGLDPKLTKQALENILRRLQDRHIPVLLAGMKAPRNMGSDYVKAFDAIYPALDVTKWVVLYPFFLDGVIGDPKLNQPDGMHPNADGVDVIVARILPHVEKLIALVLLARGW